MRHANRWHLLLPTPGPVPLWGMHIYTFVVSRAFMAGAASQAGDAAPPWHLVSPLVCRSPWMSTVMLYCWCHSDSASVLFCSSYVARYRMICLVLLYFACLLMLRPISPELVLCPDSEFRTSLGTSVLLTNQTLPINKTFKQQKSKLKKQNIMKHIVTSNDKPDATM